MARRTLIVGGGYAGLVCALRLARKARGAARVDVVSARPWFVERIRLHEDAAGRGPARRSIDAMLRGSGAELSVGIVRGIDLVNRRATVERANGEVEEAFDDLVLATGSVARAHAVPGFEHAWSCATEEDALGLRARLAARPCGRVVIVGGGLTGVELASELAEARGDLRITLVSNDEVAPMLGDEGRQHVRRALARRGVTLRERERVVAVERGAVILASGSALETDATVWCGGFEATPLAASAGLGTDAHGRAFVDARLRSATHPFVRVVGDAAHVAITSGEGVTRPARMACATALPQGAFAADDLARELTGRAETPAPAFAFAYAAQCVSLGRRDGVIHHVDAVDTPMRRWVGGRTGAWLKELVCRYTVASLSLERRGIGYHWPQPLRLTTRSSAQARLTRGLHE